jgi:hypothetical protein
MLVLCDQRPVPFQVAGQELVAADGMGIRISLAGEYRIANPGCFAIESCDSFATFYLELKQAVRLAAAETNGDGFFRELHQLTARIRELVQPKESQLGIEMTQLAIYEAVPIGWTRQA